MEQWGESRSREAAGERYVNVCLLVMQACVGGSEKGGLVLAWLDEWSSGGRADRARYVVANHYHCKVIHN